MVLEIMVGFLELWWVGSEHWLTGEKSCGVAWGKWTIHEVTDYKWVTWSWGGGWKGQPWVEQSG